MASLCPALTPLLFFSRKSCCIIAIKAPKQKEKYGKAALLASFPGSFKGVLCHPDWGLTMGTAVCLSAQAAALYAKREESAALMKRSRGAEWRCCLRAPPCGAAGGQELLSPSSSASPRELRGCVTAGNDQQNTLRAPGGFTQRGHIRIHPPARVSFAKRFPKIRVGALCWGTSRYCSHSVPRSAIFRPPTEPPPGPGTHGSLQAPTGRSSGRSPALAVTSCFVPASLLRAHRRAAAVRRLLAPPCGAARSRAERVRTAPTGSAPLYCGCAGSGRGARQRAGCKRRRETRGGKRGAAGGWKLWCVLLVSLFRGGGWRESG